jgi:methylmalonyl-CoA mutase
LPDLNLLFANIGFEYIQTSFEFSTYEQFIEISKFLKDKNVKFNVLNDIHLSKIGFDTYQTIRVDFIQQAGANASQELSYALIAGHEALKVQIESGKSISEANKNIHFNFGIGSNYLVEISKFRAFQALWQSILTKYDSDFSGKATISAQTTFVNKSLKDPHTNMLRQTTEAMSAVLGGVDCLCILPYDVFSETGANAFSERMALNISNVIAEESYLDIVNDPAKGSYSIEYLMQLLISSSWSYFQKWNTKSYQETISDLQVEIKKTAQLRTERFLEKKDQLIGINVYPNAKPSSNQWKMEGNEFFPALILEQH